jgi:hypothetical protein
MGEPGALINIHVAFPTTVGPVFGRGCSIASSFSSGSIKFRDVVASASGNHASSIDISPQGTSP